MRHAHRTADAGRNEAEAKVASARALLAETQAMAEKARADVDGAAARVGVAEAELQQAQTMSHYTVLRSPFDGVVTSRRVHTGHFVGGAAGEPLLVLLRTDPVRVTVEIPESEAALVRPGEDATIRVLALPKLKVVGKVTRTSGSLNPNNRTLRVEMDAPNADGRLIPGMYVHATVAVADRKNVLTLPTSAVLKSPSGSETCFVIKDGKLDQRTVSTGIVAGDLMEILSGLHAGENVVKTASATLVAGAAAEPAQPAASTR
jgi:RND family efflux transporter MFP subunit